MVQRVHALKFCESSDDALTQRLQLREIAVGVSCLRLDVRTRVRCLLFFQPAIVVCKLLAADRVRYRSHGNFGRCTKRDSITTVYRDRLRRCNAHASKENSKNYELPHSNSP